MSLTQGLQSPRTPLRRFLDRELSAGPRRLRGAYRVRLPSRAVLLPGQGVGYEAGTVGTAIDQRLRLSFTCADPVDTATLLGVAGIGATAAALGGDPAAWEALADVGRELVRRLRVTIAALELDNRAEPMLRGDDVERLLDDIAPVIGDGCCRVCGQPHARPSIGAGMTRLYCSPFCTRRAKTLRRHGWLQ